MYICIWRLPKIYYLIERKKGMATLTTFDITIPAGLLRLKNRNGSMVAQRFKKTILFWAWSYRAYSRSGQEITIEDDGYHLHHWRCLRTFWFLGVFICLHTRFYAWDMGDERIQRYQMVWCGFGLGYDDASAWFKCTSHGLNGWLLKWYLEVSWGILSLSSKYWMVDNTTTDEVYF